MEVNQTKKILRLYSAVSNRELPLNFYSNLQSRVIMVSFKVVFCSFLLWRVKKDADCALEALCDFKEFIVHFWFSTRMCSCIDLGSRCLFVYGFLAQVIAAFIFFLHSVDKEKDEKHSKEQANSTTSYNSYKREQGQKV